MSAGARLRVAALISGQGSNMAAIAVRLQPWGDRTADVVGVIADRVEAPGIALAQKALALRTQVIAADRFADRRRSFETALAQAAIDVAATPELIVLAGFMRILSAPFVHRYAGRLLNIHPSLLPKYKGLHTHRRVLQAGEREHGGSGH